MLSATVKFADDAAALEKTLQAAAQCVQARTQFNLARRYFRLLKWHPCFTIAHQCLLRNEATALERLLEIAKWSFLGLYFFLEMPTITNAMGVTDYEWGPPLQREANKCWLYAIAASFLLSLFQLTALPNVTPVKEEAHDDEKDAKPDGNLTKDGKLSGDGDRVRRKLYSQLVIDACDVLIPAAALGWIPVDQVTVGVAGSISSAVAGRQIWQRVQQSA